MTAFRCDALSPDRCGGLYEGPTGIPTGLEGIWSLKSTFCGNKLNPYQKRIGGRLRQGSTVLVYENRAVFK